MAISGWFAIRRLKKSHRIDIIDAHFAFPDGYAATLVARWLGLHSSITLRGTEVRHSRRRHLRHRMLVAMQRASRVFAVSESLRGLAISLGIEPGHVVVVGNGVDSNRFQAVPRDLARMRLGIPAQGKVAVTVGGLVERKGFHRVIACIPELLGNHDLYYLVVGAPGPEGDYSAQLRDQVSKLGLLKRVIFLGPLSPDRVCEALSAADVFVLATRNEGWANVLLEAMACGLPVVTTDVGGNSEVVNRRDLGLIVPFEDHGALVDALKAALGVSWDRAAIRAYAEQNDWSNRVAQLLAEFRALSNQAPQPRSGWLSR